MRLHPKRLNRLVLPGAALALSLCASCGTHTAKPESTPRTQARPVAPATPEPAVDGDDALTPEKSMPSAEYDLPQDGPAPATQPTE